ncbi:MAG: aspartyl protease family protein [Acidobacteria bacterium]|nr:aspartyl protease family protein [Acidobacteriota bacterium]
MGQVHTQMTIVNRADEVRAIDGTISPDQIRKVTLTNVLADSGAMMLSLPIRVIEQLGLAPLKEVLASTAAGYQRTRVFQDAKVSIGDRVGVFQCLELPGGDNPLLGVIPMEELGLELDLQKQELKLLPMEPGNSYLLAYGHSIHNLEGAPLDVSEMRESQQ